MRFPLFLTFYLGFINPAFANSETYLIDKLADGFLNYILDGIKRNGFISRDDPTISLN